MGRQWIQELSECPWNEDSKLILIGLKIRDIDFSEGSDTNLVFLLDVSGSMQDYNKLPLMQKAFNILCRRHSVKILFC